MFKPILKTFSKILFYLSAFVAISIDAYHKFNLQEGMRGYNIALAAYLYFSLYLGLILVKKIIKIKNSLTKSIIFVFNWFIPIFILLHSESIPQKGVLSSLIDVVFFVIFFCAAFFTLYLLFRIRKFIAMSLLVVAALSVIIWSFYDETQKSKNSKPANVPQVVVQEVQPWQLNSRYKINSIVKFLKVDLDKDGKDELAAITSNDQFPDEVFYYAGFYRYNPATEVWDEFYSDELNILNYGLVKDQPPEKQADYKKAIIDMWSTKFTDLENIGDVTGDGCPEIVFSSLIQGKNLDTNIIIAQAGPTLPFFKIRTFMDTGANVVVEDGLLIEKYQYQNNDVKDIYQWDTTNLYFKLIESQKTKIPEPTTPPQAIPGLDDLAS